MAMSSSNSTHTKCAHRVEIMVYTTCRPLHAPRASFGQVGRDYNSITTCGKKTANDLYYYWQPCRPQIDSCLYILRVLRCLKGATGINPFIGVVLDEDSDIINSFLCELPAKGPLYEIMARAIKSGQPVDWERREKWCRQYIPTISSWDPWQEHQFAGSPLTPTIMLCCIIICKQNSHTTISKRAYCPLNTVS